MSDTDGSRDSSTATRSGDPGRNAQPLASDFDEALAAVAKREEFSAYRSRADEIAEVVRQGRDVVETRVGQRDADSELAARALNRDMNATWRSALNLWIATVCLLLCASILVALAGFLARRVADWIAPTTALAFGVLALLLAGGVSLATRATSRRWYITRLLVVQAKENDRLEREQWLDASLSAAYSLAVGTVFGRTEVSVPAAAAPRLVELTTDSIVSRLSIERIQRFVEDHQTSAIGVTGPRGAGKSTLLRALADRAIEIGGAAVVVPSPVEHNPLELLRTITEAVYESQLIRFDIDDRLDVRRRERAQRMVGLARSVMLWIGLGSVAMLVGIGIVLSSASEGSYFGLFGSIGWEFALGLGVAFAGACAWIVGAVNYSAAISQRRPAPRSVIQLRQILEGFKFEVAESTSASAGVSGSVELSVERSYGRTSREFTRSRLLSELKGVLRQLASEVDGPFVLAIDELDKLPSRDALLATVNAVKDLLHVPNVHVAISLSDEALSSFELRETSERDAFDSTFDTIIDVERLDVANALELVESRVTGVPRDLARTCFVWSGGLPRDLIRHVRSCIEIARGGDVGRSWRTVALSALDRDIRQKLSAAIRSGVPLDEIEALEDASSCWAARPPRAAELADASYLSEVSSRLAAYAATCYAAVWLISASSSDDTAMDLSLIKLRDCAVAASSPLGLQLILREVRALEADGTFDESNLPVAAGDTRE